MLSLHQHKRFLALVLHHRNTGDCSCLGNAYPLTEACIFTGLGVPSSYLLGVCLDSAP